MNAIESKMLKKLIENKRANYLSDIKITPHQIAFLLYPTNDLSLTEGQFSVLKKFLQEIGENKFYLTQFDGGYLKVRKILNGIFSIANPVYKFNLNTNYEDYCKPFLFSVSVLFSINGTWAILIDETFDAGYGIFVSSEYYIDKLKALYEPIKTEYRDWMDDKRYEEDVEYYRNQLTASGVIFKN